MAWVFALDWYLLPIDSYQHRCIVDSATYQPKQEGPFLPLQTESNQEQDGNTTAGPKPCMFNSRSVFIDSRHQDKHVCHYEEQSKQEQVKEEHEYCPSRCPTAKEISANDGQMGAEFDAYKTTSLP